MVPSPCLRWLLVAVTTLPCQGLAVLQGSWGCLSSEVGAMGLSLGIGQEMQDLAPHSPF